jgi:aldehyde dehydrogenase (NAD+)
LIKEAGIPDGVVNIVPGLGEQAGAALARHRGIDHMAFTGSPQVGRFIAATCGHNLVPAKLELGGKGAAVVFDDVHVPSTVASLVRALTLNAGQVCCTATRWLVHDRIYDDFVSSAKAQLTRVRLGYWSDAETEMGPLISQKQRDRVLGYIVNGVREGAELLLPGGLGEVPRHSGGFWVKPALLAGPCENIACRDEIFGPVAYLLRFHTEEEAVKLVNRSAYGLANSVWTKDLSRAKRVAEAMVAGNSWINTHNVFAHGIPYSGIRQSGLGGGLLGESALSDYFRSQSIVRSLEP